MNQHFNTGAMEEERKTNF